jgi:8-oxo-dGTP pyrophosphatase MutT (NUDIX family)
MRGPAPASARHGVISLPREAARGRNDRMAIHSWPGRDALPPVRKWSASEPRQLYRNRRITVEEVQVSTGTGDPFPHQVIRFASDSVAAVVHRHGHGVLMLYRHRFITDRAGLALPAGGIEPGENPVDAAVREVFEETGCKLQDATLFGSSEVLPGVHDKRFWFAYGTADAGDAPDPADAHESTALYWVPVRELFGLMTAGLISAQPSMLALLYADKAGLLRELPHRKEGQTWQRTPRHGTAG